MAKKGRTSFTIAEINRLHQLFIEKDQTTDQDIEEDLTMEEIDHLKDEDLIEYNDFLEEESEIDA